MNIDQRQKLEDNLNYILTMRPALNKQALFSDTTPDYVSPAEPRPKDKVTIKFRTAKNNVDMVNLLSGDDVLTMEKIESDDRFDYYACRFIIGEDPFKYCFQIKVGKVVCYYNARGISRDIQEFYNFRVLPGFRTPNWAKGAVMYQIFVDRFYNGDKTNDVLTNEYYYLYDYSTQVTDWDKYPAQMGVREFYGGDLQGVLDKMNYLEDLGVDVIYFNPLFVSPSNHGYDIQDYDNIDPHIGKIVEDEGELLTNGQKENRQATKYINRVANQKNLDASNELFAQVVAEAHKRGMKVILDGVFNHCGSFNKWLDRERIYEDREGYEQGAYISAESPYKDYFDFKKDDAWPYNTTYDGWWGHDTLPKLNYEGSKDLCDYIIKIGQKWVSAPYNADGWRLDVAADLGHSAEFNHKFWKNFRKAVKTANPNAVIIAEHYGTSRDWLMGDEWDSIMNYDAFMEPITWFLTGMQKHSDDYRDDLRGNADSFWGAMDHHKTNFSNSSLQMSMNELSNHDHSRFLTRTNRKVGRMHTLGCEAANEGINKAVFREAVIMQMTWPGAPTIYYGDEAGVCGFTDPDNRRTYPWGHEDKDLIEFHKHMIRIHKLNTPLLTGSLLNLGQDYNFISYARFNRTEQIIVTVNNNDHEITKQIPVWRAGVEEDALLERLIMSDREGYTLDRLLVSVEKGIASITLPAESACVFRSNSASDIQLFDGDDNIQSIFDKKEEVSHIELVDLSKKIVKKESSLGQSVEKEKEKDGQKDINEKPLEEREEVVIDLDETETKEPDDVEKDNHSEAEIKKSAWDLASEKWGTPEDNKKGWFPFFK